MFYVYFIYYFSLRHINRYTAVGITSGKAYCGLVGSPLRHEYAVMGPSTNLSARLMGKAKEGINLKNSILLFAL